jgi:hypothetical protein
MIGESKMNNQKTLLVGLLVTAAAIVLFETGTLRLDQNTFQAQSGMGGVVLEKSGERAVIRAGDPVFIEGRNGNSLVGNLIGVDGETIFVKDFKSDGELAFIVSDIGRLVHGEPNAVRKYFLKGLLSGAMFGVAGGSAFWFLTGGVDYGLDVLPICIGFVSVGTVPVGALTGLIRGAIKQGKAIEYVIGPNDWQIVQ